MKHDKSLKSAVVNYVIFLVSVLFGFALLFLGEIVATSLPIGSIFSGIMFFSYMYLSRSFCYFIKFQKGEKDVSRRYEAHSTRSKRKRIP